MSALPPETVKPSMSGEFVPVEVLQERRRGRLADRLAVPGRQHPIGVLQPGGQLERRKVQHCAALRGGQLTERVDGWSTPLSSRPLPFWLVTVSSEPYSVGAGRHHLDLGAVRAGYGGASQVTAS